MDDEKMEKWLDKFYELSEADTVKEQKALYDEKKGREVWEKYHL